jgi:hypothetical protein
MSRRTAYNQLSYRVFCLRSLPYARAGIRSRDGYNKPKKCPLMERRPFARLFLSRSTKDLLHRRYYAEELNASGIDLAR